MKHKLFFNKLWLRVGMLVAIMTTALAGTARAEEVTLAAGTNGSACTVNNKDGIKVGTSSKGGDMSITVPANTTTLHLHAAAWKGVSGLSLNITGATASPASLSLTADTGISNNSPFTLSGNESDFEFSIALSNITKETTLTFTSSIAKRFVVWDASADVAGGSTLEASDLALTGAPVDLSFDLYNNSAAQTVSYTTSSTGAVTVSGGEGYVTTSVSGNTITVTPEAVTSTPQTITVSQVADDTYAAGTATFTVSVADSTPFDGGDVTFVAGTDKGSTTANNSADEVTKSGVTMSSTDAAFATAEYRFYQNSTTTFSTSSGKITKIVFTNAGTDKPCSNLSTTVGTYTENTWTGSATSVSFTASAQARASQVVVTVTPDGAVAEPTITGTTPFLDNTEVTITAEDGATIYYTTDGSTPTASSTQYTGAFTVSATTTVKAIAVKDNNTSSVAEATFTKATVMTVAEARAAIDALGTNETISDAYVSGIVSQVSSFSDTYKSITYYISDDGTTTNQLEVYSGKGLNGADFSDINGVQEGDVVVVLGTLKLFGSTYEFDKNSKIVSIVTKTDPGLAFATTEYTVAPGAEFTTPTLTNPNNLTVTYSSSDDNLAFVDETTGEVLIGDEEGTVTITASFAGDATYRAGSASYTITIVDETKGTIDNPYTVADVIAGKVTRQSVYVIGYIVGEFNSKTQGPRTSSFTTDSNIALADEFTTSPTAAASIPIQLPTNDLKTAWGCQTNNGSTIGTKVIVCGNGESYFSVNGIKNTSSVTAVAQSVTVTPAGYATIVAKANLEIPENVEVYAVTVGESASSAQLTEVTGGVPAGNAVLVKASAGTYEFAYASTTPDAIDKNDLHASDGTVTGAAGNIFALAKKNDVVGFYKVGQDVTIPAGKAYLEVTATTPSSVKSFYGFEDDATGIEAIDHSPLTIEGAVYNLAGQRLQKMQKGINIVNGKKIAVK